MRSACLDYKISFPLQNVEELAFGPGDVPIFAYLLSSLNQDYFIYSFPDFISVFNIGFKVIACINSTELANEFTSEDDR